MTSATAHTRRLPRLAAIAPALALGLVAWSPPALAGPTLICHQNDIGNAASLPWAKGKDWNQPLADYPANRLVGETLTLLAPRTPVLVRMETLRRATIYARKHAEAGRPGLADELLSRLQARALDAEAAGRSDPLAWFDAGYLVESLKQWSPPHQNGPDGYLWVQKALRARGEDPEMEFAAVLMTHETPTRPGRHWAKLQAGGQGNPLLARNIAARFSASEQQHPSVRH